MLDVTKKYSCVVVDVVVSNSQHPAPPAGPSVEIYPATAEFAELSVQVPFEDVPKRVGDVEYASLISMTRALPYVLVTLCNFDAIIKNGWSLSYSQNLLLESFWVN